MRCLTFWWRRFDDLGDRAIKLGTVYGADASGLLFSDKLF